MIPTVEQVLDAAKALKEQRVADTDIPVEGLDIPPSVVFWREGREVAKVWCKAVDRDMALDVAHVGVGGFAADVVLMVSDTFSAKRKWMDDRKRGPKPGELQRVFDKGRTDLVGEGLAAIWVTRIGETYAKIISYELDRKKRTLTWQDDHELLAGKEVQGWVPEQLRAAFEHGDMMVEVTNTTGLAPEDFGLDYRQARLHVDIVVSREIVARGHLVGMPAYTDDDAAVVLRSMEVEGISYYAITPDGDERTFGPYFDDLT